MIRPVPFVSGLGLLVFAWASLLIGQAQFYKHMAAHMVVVALAAPLLAFGIAGSRWDPTRRAGSVFSPLLASLIELFVVWIWHLPALHELARRSLLVLIAEQASFLGSGLILWIAILGGDRLETRQGEGIVALLLTAMHMTLFGALLALSRRPFYDHPHAAGMLSALDDQQVGGAIMILVGGVSYFAGGIWLSWRLLTYRRA